MMENLASLENILGQRFKDPSLLEQALTHRSFIHENPGTSLSHNERLEFLGDAVLNHVVAERLYAHTPPLSEGEMTMRRGALVRAETLTLVALSLDLGEYLRLGRGEEASGGRERPSIIGRALEAIIAAVFLDQGMEAARELIWRFLELEWRLVMSGRGITDYKSDLQQRLQAMGKSHPHYRVVEEAGPAHAKQFVLEAYIDGQRIGWGQGKSKREAEMEAARSALIGLG